MNPFNLFKGKDDDGELAGTPAPAAQSAAQSAALDIEATRQKIVEAVRLVYDPEIPVNIYELGLVYDIDVSPEGSVRVTMTLTSPSCPAAETLPPEVEQRVAAVEGVKDATIHVVWEPAWNPDMMSEAAKLELNMF